MFVEMLEGDMVNKEKEIDIINLFSKIGNRNNKYLLKELFEKSYMSNKELTLKMLFFLRDIRGGQGDRDNFIHLYEVLSDLDIRTAINNIKFVPEYGRYDDMIKIAFMTKNKNLKNRILEIICNQIKEEYKEKKFSLLFKWLPSINASSKSTKKMAYMVMNMLFKNKDYGHIEKYTKYRKILSEGRNYLKIVEKDLSTKNIQNIKYETVPSLAMSKYRTSFYRKDEDRFKEYLESVKKGTSKMNATTLIPFDIVKSYMAKLNYDEVLEQLWKNLPDVLKYKYDNTMCVVDVSGSMAGIPMEVAISLGLYCSEHNKGVWNNKMMTFSSNPTFVTVSNNMSLLDKIEKVYKADWGGSTDIEKVFSQILKTAVKHNINKDDMVKQIIIISDMQFNSATGSNFDIKKCFKNLKYEFDKCGYTLPKLVFWNVSNYDEIYPMEKDENGISYVSGYSPVIFKSVINSNFISAMDIINNTLNVERYEQIKISE